MKVNSNAFAACLLALALPFAVQAANPATPATPADHAAATVKKKKAQIPPNSVKLVDLNKASTQELMTLPGIGQADADRIVANRPYLVKSDLVNKKVLPTGPYLAVRKRVVALPHGAVPKPPKTAASAKPPKA
jgi:competence protein ComEA